MAKGRALAQLIMHMSHLTPVGWGYFACSVEASIPLQSYECGFLRGIATVSLGGGQSQIMPQMLRTDNSVVKQSIA